MSTSLSRIAGDYNRTNPNGNGRSKIGNHFPAGWSDHARATLGSMGNTAGLPAFFQFGTVPGERTSKEYVDIYVNGEIGIAQNKDVGQNNERTLTGEYLPIVDVPFDPKGFGRQQNQLAVLGFSLAALGGYFL